MGDSARIGGVVAPTGNLRGVGEGLKPGTRSVPHKDTRDINVMSPLASESIFSGMGENSCGLRVTHPPREGSRCSLTDEPRVSNQALDFLYQ